MTTRTGEQLRPARDLGSGWQLKQGQDWIEVTAVARTWTPSTGVTTVRVHLADDSCWEYQGSAPVACRTPEEASDAS